MHNNSIFSLRIVYLIKFFFELSPKHRLKLAILNSILGLLSADVVAFSCLFLCTWSFSTCSFLYSLRALLKAVFLVAIVTSTSDGRDPPATSLAPIRLCSIRFVGTQKSAAVGACFVRSVVDCDEVVAGMVGWFGVAVSVDKGTFGVKSVWFVLLSHSAFWVNINVTSFFSTKYYVTWDWHQR